MSLLKKYWFAALPIFLLCLPLVMVGYTMSKYGYSWAEAVEVVKATGKNNTKFQETKYTERGFRKIDVGMSGRDVYEIIGQPLERNTPDDTIWRYSVNVGGTGYFHERTLKMKKYGAAVEEVVVRFSQPIDRKKK
jgi:outer membrane protein assembly factor BamE (lipoprotein component of BamABCDE complex)